MNMYVCIYIYICIYIHTHIIHTYTNTCAAEASGAHDFNEAVEQIAFADVVLLNKTDLVSAEEVIKAFFFLGVKSAFISCTFFLFIIGFLICLILGRTKRTLVSAEEVGQTGKALLFNSITSYYYSHMIWLR